MTGIHLDFSSLGEAYTVIGRYAVALGYGLGGGFVAIIFPLKQFAGFGEGEEGAVDRKFIFAGVFRDVEDGFDRVAVIAEKLDDEIGINHVPVPLNVGCRAGIATTIEAVISSRKGSTLRGGLAQADLAPGEVDGGVDVRVKAFVDGAGVGGALELLLVFGGDGVRDVDLDGEAFDHAGGGGGHLLFDGGGGAGEVDLEGAGHDAHDGEHAGAEGGGDEVGGGEGFAAALVIGRGVGGEVCGGGAVDCFAVQVSLVFDLDGDHGGSFSFSGYDTAKTCSGSLCLGREWVCGGGELLSCPRRMCMAAVTQYRCEICGIESTTTTHWFLIQCNHEELKIRKWDDELAAAKGARHYCGEAHAGVYVSRWLEASCTPAITDFTKPSVG
jgi:hypothetical protein